MSTENETPPVPPAPAPKPKRKTEKPVVERLCRNCVFHAADGTCHRMPPVIFNYKTERAFPMVRPEDWCGEFRP